MENIKIIEPEKFQKLEKIMFKASAILELILHLINH